jgi:arsenate reductase
MKTIFSLLIISIMTSNLSAQTLFKDLETYVNLISNTTAPGDKERKEALDDLADYIVEKKHAGKPVYFTFICTHNSRRSHLSQIWAQTFAAYYGLTDIHCFSGGTEATAFNHRAVAALKRAGFQIDNPGGNNPNYSVRFSKDAPPLICFSKTFADAPNPQKDFCAVMTCSDADKNCPFVPGADFRVPVPYVDPKEADDTPAEIARYDERTRQIAAEMRYVMRTAKQKLQ